MDSESPSGNSGYYVLGINKASLVSFRKLQHVRQGKKKREETQVAFTAEVRATQFIIFVVSCFLILHFIERRRNVLSFRKRIHSWFSHHTILNNGAVEDSSTMLILLPKEALLGKRKETMNTSTNGGIRDSDNFGSWILTPNQISLSCASTFCRNL